MVWADLSPAGNSEIFFAFSTDNGLTFSTPDNISKNTEDSGDPKISSSGNNVYVVWEEDIIPGMAETDIVFAFSTDNGQTFSPPVNLTTILAISLIHKSPLQEITYMLYGKETALLLAAMMISFLHSV